MTNSTAADQPAGAPGWRWSPHFVLAFVALWPAPGYAEGVMVLGALVAIFLLLRARFAHGTALLSVQAWALTSVLFCAYWLPEVFSVFGAVDGSRAMREAIVDLRYLPFLWLVASSVANARGRRITFIGLAVIVAVWALDGMAEAFLGTSPLFFGIDGAKQLISGRPMCSAEDLMEADRLGGVLGPCNLKLGLVLASLSPFLLFPLARRFGTGGWVAGAVAIGIVVLLAGARASWVTFALVLVFSGWRLLGWKRLLAVFAGGAVVLTALALVSPQVRDRVERTAQLATADESGVDMALSGRLTIWKAALCMVRESPVNGVGVRGFRQVYADHAVDGDWLLEDGGAFHAHQLLLEVATETGAIGVLGWLAGLALLWRSARRRPAAARGQAWPVLLALAAMCFPLNTHYAFYSSWWGLFFWWLLAVAVAALHVRDDCPPPAAPDDQRRPPLPVA